MQLKVPYKNYKKDIKNKLSIRQILSELVAFGFWYSNSDLVTNLLKLINQMLTSEEILLLQKGAGQVLDNLLLKLIYFWLFQIPNINQLYPEVFRQILFFIEKLSLSSYYNNLLRNNKITKKISEVSKLNDRGQFSKICLNIIRNMNGKNRHLSAPNSLKINYNENIFQSQNFDSYTLEQALQLFSDNQNQDSKLKVLQIFADSRNKLCLQATVRFDYYWKLINQIFNIKYISQKVHIKAFVYIMQQLNKNTSQNRAAQLLDKNILKKIHDFLLQSPVQLHKVILKFSKNILNLAGKNGQINVKKMCQLFSSPYEDFLIILSQALQKNNETHNLKGKGFSLMYINNIKDFIRLSLKSSNSLVMRPLLKILSNLSLDQQCRYQIINLKGIQIFVKLLQTNRGETDIQRVCAKGLLNLALSSKEVKVKVLAQMTNIIEMYYKRELDSIASGYVETILKSSKV